MNVQCCGDREDRAQTRIGTSRGLYHLNHKEECLSNPSQATVKITCNKGSEIPTNCGHPNSYLFKGQHHPSHSAELRGRRVPIPALLIWEGLQRLGSCQTQVNLHLLGTHFRFHNLKCLALLSKVDNISQEVYIYTCG